MNHDSYSNAHYSLFISDQRIHDDLRRIPIPRPPSHLRKTQGRRTSQAPSQIHRCPAFQQSQCHSHLCHGRNLHWRRQSPPFLRNVSIGLDGAGGVVSIELEKQRWNEKTMKRNAFYRGYSQSFSLFRSYVLAATCTTVSFDSTMDSRTNEWKNTIHTHNTTTINPLVLQHSQQFPWRSSNECDLIWFDSIGFTMMYFRWIDSNTFSQQIYSKSCNMDSESNKFIHVEKRNNNKRPSRVRRRPDRAGIFVVFKGRGHRHFQFVRSFVHAIDWFCRLYIIQTSAFTFPMSGDLRMDKYTSFFSTFYFCGDYQNNDSLATSLHRGLRGCYWLLLPPRSFFHTMHVWYLRRERFRSL